MIYLYSDYITESGGIETYLHALSAKLVEEERPFRVAVAEIEHCPLLDEIEDWGVDVYRQGWIPGDRWDVRHRVLREWLRWQLEPGDWVYCVRQPLPRRMLSFVRMVHTQDAKVAASWRMAPALMGDLSPENEGDVKRAVDEMDRVISVSECTVDQFEERYDYEGPVEVVRYHNLPFFDEPVPMPDGPPWRVGFMGRLGTAQKNLDTLLRAFRNLGREEEQVELHLYGSGQDRPELETMAADLGISDRVFFHGRYDHRTDLRGIMANTHFFVYTSRYEGGPCFTLLELMQAGRYVVASEVGGIPDLYEGHPEAGLLIRDHDEVDAVEEALRLGLFRVRNGKVEGETIRKRYFSEFDMDAAHAQWKRALEIEPQMSQEIL